MTVTACASPLGSVDGDGLSLPIIKLKSKKRVDLSTMKLGDASAVIIASYIKENRVLKELECAAAPYSVCFGVSAR